MKTTSHLCPSLGIALLLSTAACGGSDAASGSGSGGAGAGASGAGAGGPGGGGQAGGGQGGGASCETSPFTGAMKHAASCSAADVQAAIDRAADGDIILVPKGMCTWSQSVVLDASSRSLSLRGDPGGGTVISVQTDGAVQANGGAGKSWALSHFHFTDGAGDAVVAIGGGSTSWRAHDLDFRTNGVPLRLFRVYGATYGVIDHNTVDADVSEFVTSDNEDWSAWITPQQLGDEKATYIEDNDVVFNGHWEGRPGIDGERGGREVLRHNRTTNSVPGGHGFDSGSSASNLRVEVYENVFSVPDNPDGTWAALALVRGGTGVFWGNRWKLGPNVWAGLSMNLTVYRSPDVNPGTLSWHVCDGTQLRFCSNIDKSWSVLHGDAPKDCTDDTSCDAGDTCKWKLCSKSKMNLCTADGDCPSGETCTAFIDGDGTAGYPCYMQPGFGTGMQPAPLYEWDNTFEGSQNQPNGGNVDFAGDGTLVKKGRDYFDDTKMPGYVPFAYPHPLTCTLD